MLKKCASRIYMILIFAFLYLPIIVLIALCIWPIMRSVLAL